MNELLKAGLPGKRHCLFCKQSRVLSDTHLECGKLLDRIRRECDDFGVAAPVSFAKRDISRADASECSHYEEDIAALEIAEYGNYKTMSVNEKAVLHIEDVPKGTQGWWKLYALYKERMRKRLLQLSFVVNELEKKLEKELGPGEEKSEEERGG